MALKSLSNRSQKPIKDTYKSIKTLEHQRRLQRVCAITLNRED